MLRALALWLVGQLLTCEQVSRFVSYLMDWLHERAHESNTPIDDQVIDAIESILTQPDVVADLCAWLERAIRGSEG